MEGVWENSPADRAGIKPGDIILGYNSKKVTPDNLLKLRNMMRDDKVKSIDFEVKEQNSIRDIKLIKDMLL